MEVSREVNGKSKGKPRKKVSAKKGRSFEFGLASAVSFAGKVGAALAAEGRFEVKVRGFLFSRGRDFGPGAYLYVVLGTSTRPRADSPRARESAHGRGNQNALSLL